MFISKPKFTGTFSNIGLKNSGRPDDRRPITFEMLDQFCARLASDNPDKVTVSSQYEDTYTRSNTYTGTNKTEYEQKDRMGSVFIFPTVPGARGLVKQLDEQLLKFLKEKGEPIEANGVRIYPKEPQYFDHMVQYTSLPD
jgi:hypothetical protein